MRAILIDPKLQQVREIDVEQDIPALEELVGVRGLGSFRIAEHEGGFDYGWVDDRGLAKGEPVFAFRFKYPGGHKGDPVAGRCVIVGCDLSGDPVDALTPVEFFTTVIDWIGEIVPSVDWVQDGNVTRGVVTYERVVKP